MGWVVWVDQALARPPLPLEHVDIQVDRVADKVSVRAGLQTEAGEAAGQAFYNGALFFCASPSTADQELFGMNVRFFYDDDILELIDFCDFLGGYD